MSTRNAEYIEAINHMPAGAILLFSDVTWEEYESLLEDLGDRPGRRVAYDEGKLEIVSPSQEHERGKEFILKMAAILSEELDIPLETFGSATWKRRKLRKGVEADTCFYVANAARIIGKGEIDLESDPPPDVVVEIEATRKSLSKFPIYAAFRVPEIWRYDGKRMQVYGLTPEFQYVEVKDSRFFPGLTSSVLTEFLELSKTQGQTKALKAFRKRIRSGIPPSP